jgi:uncharacterized protein (TIGR03663 family)
VISQTTKPSNLLDRQFPSIRLNWEVILFGLLILVAITTRFYDLGARVMSHDESLHTYYSWLYFKGQGYQHSPMMHGPLQFHFLSLVFNILGDSDFTARIPAALASVATVLFIWNYRRYLGRIGALITAGLFVISPYMLYYGRYVRNEAFVVLIGLISLWAILRYLETGRVNYLYVLSAAVAFHFTTKETSFIYLAQSLLFLGLIFLNQITKNPWQSSFFRAAFFSILIIVLLLAAVGLGFVLVRNAQNILMPDEIAPPVIPETDGFEGSAAPLLSPVVIALILGGLIILSMSLFYLFSGYGVENLRKLRSFDLLILLGSLVIPHLSAFPIRMLGWDPLDYHNTLSIQRIGGVLIVMIGLSIAIGLWWKPRIWLVNNAIFYGIFFVLFTSLFTNSTGFFTGLVGSLGYWLVQQGVERGNQPVYYYALVQIPMYEYLAALGTLLAAGIGFRYFISRGYNSGTKTQVPQSDGDKDTPGTQQIPLNNHGTAMLLFGFWTFTSFLAYTVAGEKMPWLSVHILLPMLMLTGWALGLLVDRINLAELKDESRWLALIYIPLLIISLFGISSNLLSNIIPFSGKSLEQIEATSTFLLAFLIFALSLWGLYRVVKSWDRRQIMSLSILFFFALLSLQTIRTAFTAAYVNYDRPTEYLVYAHSAGGVKDVMEKVEEISRRTTDGLAIEVAFDDDISWPFTWYLRNYRNQRFYGADPTREIRNVPIILIGDNNFHKIDPIVGDGYDRFDYIRMWWPNQDYFGLTWEKLRSYLTDPELRRGIFQIWMSRDYTAYGQATGRDFSLPNWSPADKMRMYIRKDIIADLWDYGVGAHKEAIVIDPYENKQIQLIPDIEIQTDEDGSLLFNAPRGIAMAPDGSLFVADSQNHRILHIKDEKIENTWGGFSAPADDIAPMGTFNEPWGIAVSPDGDYVYVADTWNHRIQKFTSKGEFINSWGYFGQVDDPFAFWGPRDIAIDSEGNVFVSNTGNKRINVFSPKGEFLNQFGSVGFALGQFDEPVGIAIDSVSGLVFIADTWNQRIQSFQMDSLDNYIPASNWDISGWYGQALDNKPYLAIGPDGNLYVTDPELSRVLVFRTDGEFIHYFGDFEIGNLGIPIGITSDGDNGIWISDSKNNRLLHFTIP